MQAYFVHILCLYMGCVLRNFGFLVHTYVAILTKLACSAIAGRNRAE